MLIKKRSPVFSHIFILCLLLCCNSLRAEVTADSAWSKAKILFVFGLYQAGQAVVAETDQVTVDVYDRNSKEPVAICKRNEEMDCCFISLHDHAKLLGAVLPSSSHLELEDDPIACAAYSNKICTAQSIIPQLGLVGNFIKKMGQYSFVSAGALEPDIDWIEEKLQLGSASDNPLIRKSSKLKQKQLKHIKGLMNPLYLKFFGAINQVYLSFLEGSLPNDNSYSFSMGAIFSSYDFQIDNYVEYRSNSKVYVMSHHYLFHSPEEIDELWDLIQDTDDINRYFGLYTIFSEVGARELHDYMKKFELHSAFDVFAGSAFVGERLQRLGFPVYSCDIKPPEKTFGYVEKADAQDCIESNSNNVNSETVLLVIAPSPNLFSKNGGYIRFIEYLPHLVKKWIDAGGNDIIISTDIYQIEKTVENICSELGLRYTDVSDSHQLRNFSLESAPFAYSILHITRRLPEKTEL